PTLVLSNVSLDLAGSYTVVVTNSYGTATSVPAQLTVGLPPLITSDPISQTVLAGDTALFTVAAQGTEPLTYQWYFNDTIILPGETNTTLTLTNVIPAKAGTYTVAVANNFGNATSAAARLNVGGAPFIISNPSRQVATNGGTAVFTVTVQGSAPLSY